jgi:hypothetical protein
MFCKSSELREDWYAASPEQSRGSALSLYKTKNFHKTTARLLFCVPSLNIKLAKKHQ